MQAVEAVTAFSRSIFFYALALVGNLGSLEYQKYTLRHFTTSQFSVGCDDKASTFPILCGGGFDVERELKMLWIRKDPLVEDALKPREKRVFLYILLEFWIAFEF